MESSKDTIIVRLNNLNEILFKSSSQPLDGLVHISTDTLLDAIQVLYDECDTDRLKSMDSNIASFVDVYRKAIMELKRIRVNISDFEVKATIGRGHFGEVHIVTEKQSGDIYAMKTVRKMTNIMFINEKNIMANSRSPWITMLQYSFQDCNNLYFVMDYHPGGNLLELICRQGGTISETAAIFYLCEVILALNDLHKMGFIHRDIKPDNILLDRCGHLKLADFGSAARINRRGMVTHGLPIGTPDYIAPEVLRSMDNKNGSSYGIACDYWSLGILAYELIAGYTPFSDQSTTVTYSKIMSYTNDLNFPMDIILTQGYAELLCKLIHTNVNERLNYSSVTKQPIFQHVDFHDIRDQVPPFIPYIKSNDDTSNFSEIRIRRRSTNVIIEHVMGKTQFFSKHLPYLGFTYANGMLQTKQTQRTTPPMIKDELLEHLKKTTNTLKKEQSITTTAFHDWKIHKGFMEGHLEEKTRKLESVETVRDHLEHDLTTALSDVTTLKQTLDLERKDRSELEVMALDIIASTKLKWETSEKVKIDAFHTEIENLKDLNEKLRVENELLNGEIKTNIHETIQRQKSNNMVERLRRNSIVGLENRLEQFTNDRQLKLSVMQSKLCIIANEKINLERNLRQQQNIETALRNQIINIKKQFDDSEMQNTRSMRTIKEYEDNMFSLRAESTNLNKIVDDLRHQIQANDQKKQVDISVNLEKNTKLENKVKELQNELHLLTSKYESDIEHLQTKHDHLRDEQAILHVNLRTAYTSECHSSEKMLHLQDLLTRLTNGVTILEGGSNGEQVLQEQVKRLEESKIKVNEKLVLEKYEHCQLQSKFWRLEKDFINAELDRKILERDLKDSRTQMDALRREIDVLEQQINNIIMLNDINISKYQSDNGDLEKQIEIFRIEHTICQNRNVDIGALKEVMQTKDFSIASLKTELDEVQSSVITLGNKLHGLLQEKSIYEEKLQILERDQIKSKSDVLKLNHEIDNHILNRDALRESCTILEEQLVQFERIYNMNESKLTAFSEQLENAQELCASAKTELQQVRQSVHEEKSERYLTESKARHCEEHLTVLHEEHDALLLDVAEYKRYCSETTEELSKMELKLRNCECTLREYERQIESILSLNNCFKEENSLQRTALSNMKESNHTLEHEILEMQANANIQSDRIKDLEYMLSSKTCYYEERDLKTQATIQQQIKLIDFLQSKLSSNKKDKYIVK